MGRRPKGLITTVREALRAWWRSKFDQADDQATDAVWTDGDDGGSTPPRKNKKVYVQSLPHAAALALPARDDVFCFEVIPAFRWSSTAMSRETLKARVPHHEDAAREELLRVAWSTARDCAAHEPAAAEAAINKKLSAEGNWCFDDSSGLIRCRPSVRVRMDADLREHVRPHHLDQVTISETEEVGRRRAQRALALTEAWLEVISELELLGEVDAHQRRLLVPFAATLADSDFRKVLESLRRERRTSTDALIAALEAARGNHQEAGLYEFADAYDKALSAFCREMGLKPFSWVDDAIASDGTAR
ncbi:hypothetical protein [Streptomyces sediminimaris]|uniref:hypothetical protein n=1 Tax=Streptomyces sediminimaris TaxID=3383721 RepID=UPI00399BC5E9